jgi:peptide/nickel transport system permease protein
MSRFILRRLIGTIPTLIGISLVTFVILAISMDSPETDDMGGTFSSPIGSGKLNRTRFTDAQLPLFVNFSIDDAPARAKKELAKLEDERTAPQAQRTLARAGGAWLPYIVPSLPDMTPESRPKALDALGDIAKRLDLDRALEAAPDRATFWTRYWDSYGSDFKPVRAARLVRRLVRRDDQLAVAELRHLDTFCLPQLMEALSEDISPEAKARIIDLAGELIAVNDPLDPTASTEQRRAVLDRWLDWWNQRYDRYTVFEGFRYLTGMITQTRYFRWLARMITFDFGLSVRDGRPVLSKLAERLPITFVLSLLALIVAYIIAIPLGTLGAVTKGGLFDRAIAVVMFVFYSMPAFWIAMLLLRYLGGTGYLDLFPAHGLHSPGAHAWSWWPWFADTMYHLVLPVFCLSFVPMAMLARYQRVGMSQVIDLDFMRTARAKGLSRIQVIFRHGLRNGVVPVVTMLGLQIPSLVSGSVVIESIFGIPGMGYETFQAIRAHDQPWLMAVVTVTAVMTLFGIVMADAVYAFLDPRIVPGERGGKK